MIIPSVKNKLNSYIHSYANDEDLIPGLGPVSLAGGQLLETRARDLKELYKVSVVCVRA